MNARRLLIWGLLLALSGFLVGYTWPPPPIPRTQAGSAEWSLPSAAAAARYSPETFAEITKQMRWGVNSALEAGVSSEWRLAGFLIADDPAILVMDQGSPGKAKRVAIGEQLPDGSTLHVIAGDTITTQLDACERTYQLYQLKATSASGGCAAETPADDSDKETAK